MSSTASSLPLERQTHLDDQWAVGSLEFATKMATLLIVASYAIGYLIIVINENAHGFLEASLLKPRAITAGAVFILFTALPISLTQGTFFASSSDDESLPQRIARIVLGLVEYVSACTVAAIAMLLVLVDDLHSPSMTAGKATTFVLLLYLVAFNGIFRFAFPKWYKHQPFAWIGVGLFMLCGLAFGLYALRALSIGGALLWVLCVTTVVNPYLADMRRGITFRVRASALIVMFLAAITFYSTRLFPRMKSTWGGGAPVSAIVYLSKDSPIRPSQKVKVALLESTDSGFYMIFDGDSTATYIPRASSGAIEFPPSGR